MGILKEEGQKSLKFAKVKGQMRWTDYIDINETKLWESSYKSDENIKV